VKYLLAVPYVVFGIVLIVVASIALALCGQQGSERDEWLP